MKEYERVQQLKSMLRTVLGCTGWGILGHLLMKQEATFWPGWVMLVAALMVGVYALDRYFLPKKTRW